MSQNYAYGITIKADGTSAEEIERLADALNNLNAALSQTPKGGVKAAGDIAKEAQKVENAVTLEKEKNANKRAEIQAKADAQEKNQKQEHAQDLERIERDKNNRIAEEGRKAAAKKQADADAAARRQQARAQQNAQKQDAEEKGRRRLYEEVMRRRDLEHYTTGKSQGPRNESFESWDANERKNQLSKRAAGTEVQAPGPATSVFKRLKQVETEAKLRQAMNYEVLMKPSEQLAKSREGVVKYQQFPGQNIPAYGPQATDLAKGRAAWQKANPVLGPGNDAGVAAWEKQKQSQAKQLGDAWGKAIAETGKMLEGVSKKANATGVKMARAEAAIDPRLFAEKAKRGRGATAMSEDAALKDLFAVLTPQSGSVGVRNPIDDSTSAARAAFNKQFEAANKPTRTVHPDIERMFGGVAARLTGTDQTPTPKAYGHYDPKALSAQLAKQGVLPDDRLLPTLPTDYKHKQRVDNLKATLTGMNHRRRAEQLEAAGGFAPENIDRIETAIKGKVARKRAETAMARVDRDRDYGSQESLTSTFKEFAQSIQTASSKTRRNGQAMSDSLINVSRKAASFSSALHAQQDKFRAMHYLGGSMVQQGMLIGAAGTGVVGAGMFAAKSAGEFQGKSVGIQALLGGDKKEADDFIDAIKAFDLRSPVTNLEQSMATAQNLLGAGMEKTEVIPLLDKISDAVSMMGGTQENFQAIAWQLQQAQSGAPVTQQDIRAMATSGGIPIMEILKSGLGQGRMDEYKGGKSLSGAELVKGFVDGIHKYRDGVAVGASARRVDTLPGQLSNLTSAFQKMAIAIGEKLLPFAMRATKFIIGLFNAIEWLSKTPGFAQITGAIYNLGLFIGGVLVVLGPTIIGLGILAQAVAGLETVVSIAKAAQLAYNTMLIANGGSTLLLAGQLGVLALAAYAVYNSIGWTNDALTQSEASWRKMHPTLAWLTDAAELWKGAWDSLYGFVWEKITTLLSWVGLATPYKSQSKVNEETDRKMYESDAKSRKATGKEAITYDQFKANLKAADQIGGGASGGDYADKKTATPESAAGEASAVKDLMKEIAAQTAELKSTGLTGLPTTGASEPFSQERYNLEKEYAGMDSKDPRKKELGQQLRELKLDDKYEAAGEKADRKEEKDAERERMIAAYRATGNEPAALALEGKRADAIMERKAAKELADAGKAATQQKMAVLQSQIDAENLRHRDEMTRIQAMTSLRASSRQKLMDTENRAHMVKMQSFAAERRAISTGMDFFRKAVDAMNAAMAPMQRDPRVQTEKQERLQQLPDYATGAIQNIAPEFDADKEAAALLTRARETTDQSLKAYLTGLAKSVMAAKKVLQPQTPTYRVVGERGERVAYPHAQRPAFDMAAWKVQKGENDAQWAAYRAKQSAGKQGLLGKAADARKFAPLRGLARDINSPENIADNLNRKFGDTNPFAAMKMTQRNKNVTRNSLDVERFKLLGSQEVAQRDAMWRWGRKQEPVSVGNATVTVGDTGYTVQFPPVILPLPANNAAKRRFR